MFQNRPYTRNFVALLLLALITTAPLYADLGRVGPTSADTRVGGYPAWYQDKSGLTLEFCDPLTQSEVEGGWCLLLPGDVNIPEHFPDNFFDEHFYFAAGANLTPFSGGKALLVLAVEAAFSIGPPAVGDQITFSRIRMRLTNVPTTGTYRFVHPYGEDSITEVAGAARGIFSTDDFGIGLPGGPFDLLLNGRLGPFLLPANFPGGPELPAVSPQNPTPDRNPANFGGVFTPTPYPGTGKLYIADPARLGPVTGSPKAPFMACPNSNPCTAATGGVMEDHNVFRIEGPPGSNLGGPGIDFIETTLFTLNGRVYTDTIPGRVTIERASYGRSDNGPNKLDVLATGFSTTQGRIPTQPTPDPVDPVLSYFDAHCSTDAAGNLVAPSGTAETQMLNDGSRYWAQSSFPVASVPAGVCVKDSSARNAAGNLVPAYFDATTADDVSINAATYNPTARTLTVTATSTDLGTTTTTPAIPAPTLTLAGFGKSGTDLDSSGNVTITNVLAPPAKVVVRSSAGGFRDRPVRIGVAPVAPPPTTAVAVNDSYTFNEDSGARTLAVLSNDTNATGGTVTIGSQPRLGTVSVNADGSVVYTPNPNANGADNFTYTVTVGSTTSNTANVTLNITPVNDVPVAVNDILAAVAGQATTLNVIANDTDVDGPSDINNVIITSAPVAVPGTTGTATAIAGAGGAITFNATAAGSYTFTYRAQDVAGATSSDATVTVNVTAAETVNIALAEFRTGQSRLRINGTIVPAAGQKVTIQWLRNGVVVGAVVDTPQSDVNGAWAIDVRPATGNQDPRTVGANAVLVTGPNGGSRTLALTTRN